MNEMPPNVSLRCVSGAATRACGSLMACKYLEGQRVALSEILDGAHPDRPAHSHAVHHWTRGISRNDSVVATTAGPRPPRHAAMAITGTKIRKLGPFHRLLSTPFSA